MTPTDAFNFVLDARKVPEGKFLEKEKLYNKAIDYYEKNIDDTDDSKKLFWTTKAEYLLFRTKYITKDETFEDSYNRSLDSLRYLYKCMKLNNIYEKFFSPMFTKMMVQHILVFGCILPEDETHFLVSCPIWLKTTELGKRGLSMGGYYKKAICSICGLHMLDEKCIHQIGSEYDNNTCRVIKTDFQLLHVALVDSPKDPENVIDEIKYPKKEIYDNFPPGQKKLVSEKNLPTYCSSCKQGNLDPSSLSPEKFFKMQKLSIDI